MQATCIDLVEGAGSWIVRIVERGVETRREFNVREHAVNWFQGQRVRLGLPAGTEFSIANDAGEKSL